MSVDGPIQPIPQVEIEVAKEKLINRKVELLVPVLLVVILIAIISIVLIISGRTVNQQPNPKVSEYKPSPSLSLVPKPTQPRNNSLYRNFTRMAEYDQVQINSIALDGEGNTSKLTAIELETKKEIVSVVVDSVSTEINNPVQYAKNNLFVLVDNGNTKELRKYLDTGDSVLLYRGLMSQYFVNSEASLVVISTGEMIQVMDGSGKILNRYIFSELYDEGQVASDISLNSVGEKNIWLREYVGAITTNYIRIYVANNKVDKFSTSWLPQAYLDDNLNPDTGILAFSTYPIFFETDSESDFRNSGSSVVLLVANLETKSWAEIDKSIAKRFFPRWLGVNTLEFDDPKGNQRIVKNVHLPATGSDYWYLDLLSCVHANSFLNDKLVDINRTMSEIKLKVTVKETERGCITLPEHYYSLENRRVINTDKASLGVVTNWGEVCGDYIRENVQPKCTGAGYQADGLGMVSFVADGNKPEVPSIKIDFEIIK